MSLHEIVSASALAGAIGASEASGTPLLIQYSATWCGPCSVLRRHVEALSDKLDFPVGIFYIDTAEGGEEVAAEAGITSVPVLRLFHGGQHTDLNGRNVMAIEKEINEIVGV